MRVEVFKETQEDWYPSYKMEEGRVSLVHVIFDGPNYEGNYVVCVWGNDDHGMEKWYLFEGEAWNTFLQVISTQYVSHKQLEDLGLETA